MDQMGKEINDYLKQKYREEDTRVRKRKRRKERFGEVSLDKRKESMCL